MRLQGYDYTQTGAYFLTTCVQHRECLLGSIVDGVVVLSTGGQIVQQVWDDLPVRFPGIELDAFVVMPNHVHAILVLGGSDEAGNGPVLGTVVRALESLL